MKPIYKINNFHPQKIILFPAQGNIHAGTDRNSHQLSYLADIITALWIHN